ncbi:DNA alkylation repair protein [Acanthopleuribacter pedis]|uniref:DNA alkylation repair protein n=1 Tax=Acanthopleuribacter pedis TaxID=442870 RepID=A0A8J7QPC0_9BACT|nr:DNA alkylation repair protein [Acanthopleuribacter pedis]MBO1322715.1 DNA alkylation repair protein [Acanthopleuribacter pedis]
MEPLKLVYTEAYLNRLADDVLSHDPGFAKGAFLAFVFDDQWDDRELKQRMSHIAAGLHRFIQHPYAEALAILKKAAPNYGGFEAMFFPDFVQQFGLDAWDPSIDALAWFTRFSSSEYAVRPFIKKDTPRMMAQMQAWAEHDNEHLRRLASEGCRPNLPWAPALPAFKKDPAPIWPILNRLKQDPSLYVRRSVANNLNDITKKHPEAVLDWAERNHGLHEDTDWIIKHACRTLLKAGNTRAMRLFGFEDPASVQIKAFTIKPTALPIGDTGCFSWVLVNEGTALVRQELAIDFLKANGTLSRKVFKVSEKECEAGPHPYEKTFSFQQRTTRTHYAGGHKAHLIVNGVIKASLDFTLE